MAMFEGMFFEAFLMSADFLKNISKVEIQFLIDLGESSFLEE